MDDEKLDLYLLKRKESLVKKLIMEYQNSTLDLPKTYGILGQIVETIRLMRRDEEAKIDAEIKRGNFDK